MDVGTQTRRLYLHTLNPSPNKAMTHHNLRGKRRLRIGITLGDPGGIGPEVTLKALKELPLRPACDYIIFGPKAVMERLRLKFRLPSHSQVTDLKRPLPKGTRIHFWDVSGAIRAFDVGRITQRNAVLAFAALKRATRFACEGELDALVTAPVNKGAMRLVYRGFTGHTEYLAKTSGSKHFAMMFVSDRLKVTLATVHVPLKKVSGLLSRGLIAEKITLTDKFLKDYFGIKRPRLAVCALNPHGRETGPEDEAVVRPAVRRMKAKRIQVVGPLSADQLFYDAYEGRFDAVISMYHDQGLVPFKMIAFRDGVNVTVGLPFVRTSPDHGTAYDIAYRLPADPSSMLSAIRLAGRLAACRRS